MDADLISKLRDQTPGCKNLIHFNNAGSALVPEAVLDSLHDYLDLEQQLGGYEAAEKQAVPIANFYRSLARLFNCQTEEIAWVENSTRAWNILFQSIGFQPGDRVVTGQTEYASNYLAMLHMRKRLGIEINVIPNDESGVIDLDRLERGIDARTRLIALTHVPSQQGVVQPAAAVGEIARRHGLLYLLDVSQSAGQIPVDVQALGCHMLTGSGRKYLRGPRGTGFLYVNRETIAGLDPPFVDLQAAQWVTPDDFRLRDDARRFENWECYVAGKIALGVAVDYAVSLGMEAIQRRIGALSRTLHSCLESVPGVMLHDPPSHNIGIVTFSKQDVVAADLQARLRAAGINSGLAKRANALLDFSRRGLEDINRLSLHYYNTEEEIERLVKVLTRA